MNKITTLSLAAITALFIGCGGGGSSDTPAADTSAPETVTPTLSGIFTDSPVKGISYTCKASNTQGTTDVDGRYTCATGDTEVTFSIGTVNLGTTPIAEVITPRSFFLGANRDAEILNLAQLLQTMDIDGNPENGIELDSIDIENWQSANIGFDHAQFDSEMATKLGKTMVTELVAQTHLNGTFTEHGLDVISAIKTPNTSTTTDEENNTGMPKNNEINGKNIIIYNNVVEQNLSSAEKNHDLINMTKYDGNVAFHCTDYGYSMTILDGTFDDIHTKSYYIIGGENGCIETDYKDASSSGLQGSDFVIFWN